MYFRGGGYLRAKRQTRRAWDAEYGRIGREGNMWWLGTIRANWEQVFGSKTWTWLRTSSLFRSIVRCVALLTIKYLKQSRLGRPRDKGWGTLGTRALTRTGCGCRGSSGRQNCDSCVTVTFDHDDNDLSSDLHGSLLPAWQYWMYIQHAIICRHFLFFALPFRLWPCFEYE